MPALPGRAAGLNVFEIGIGDYLIAWGEILGRVTLHASIRAIASSSAANRNGAPGKCQLRRGPMKLAKVSVKSAGPIKPEMPRKLPFAP